MVNKIKILPMHIANQIAAGEVIERPSSIVKELLENAIDAEAEQIIVEIGFGGLNSIKISDNGIGISAEDLPLAIMPHATSKIEQLEDLYAIKSMGFRGEALASIAAIAQVNISSCPKNQDNAMLLEIIDGKPVVTHCARSYGTTITVNNIFYNAPVRKKFLKSERHEFQAIDNIVKQLAMSSPEIAITLIHNGKLCWLLPAVLCQHDMIKRVTKLFSKKFITAAKYIDVEFSGMRLNGWISGDSYQRSQNDNAWFYLNNRSVKDKLLHHALKQAYVDLLYHGRYPSCVLYLTIDPQEVDVNVHPTKHEVRFKNPRLVHDFICVQIHQLLEPYRIYKQAEILDVSYKSIINISNMQTEVLNIDSYIQDQFAVINFQQQIYLADIKSLYNLWYSEFLLNESFPWRKRDLLVTIACEINLAQDLSLYDELINLLTQLGISLSLLSGEHTIVVKSIPILILQLDIKKFLKEVFSDLQLWSIPDLITVLLKYIIQDEHTFAQEKFKNYLINNFTKLLEQKKFLRCLSTQLCQTLLYNCNERQKNNELS